MTEPLFSCQEQLVPGKTYAEKFNFLAEAGFSGIEIWSQNLSGHEDELINLSESTGVRISSGCQGFDGGIINIDETGRSMAIEATKAALDSLAQVKAAGFVLPSGFALGSKVMPPFKPPRSAEEDYRALCDSLEQILPRAADRKIAIFLEPINRYEIHYLNKLSEAEEIASHYKNPWLKVMADFYHMNIEEANLSDALSQAAGYLGHVHLGDSNRKLPGQGHLDFAVLFQTLQRMNYQGWLAIECDRPTDAARELPVALDYMKKCWPKATGE